MEPAEKRRFSEKEEEAREGNEGELGHYVNIILELLYKQYM